MLKLWREVSWEGTWLDGWERTVLLKGVSGMNELGFDVLNLLMNFDNLQMIFQYRVL